MLVELPFTGAKRQRRHTSRNLCHKQLRFLKHSFPLFIWQWQNPNLKPCTKLSSQIKPCQAKVIKDGIDFDLAKDLAW
ncbi:hypothetical protein F8388_024463 [Cannabis sativa]|uniref:Uncharacterized protein n=1 Tax=Cannabis sativa TaxID=3483 RepID=A0A7J6HZQ1_CANSA|nr:hypothetical protein F8388_024463 [Cannabis sativa]KAF4400319.1 hypothetical protein G4B88_019528 [Cannabis sativa]